MVDIGFPELLTLVQTVAIIAAELGCRFTHRQARSIRPARRAWMGSPRSQRSNSSATASALP